MEHLDHENLWACSKAIFAFLTLNSGDSVSVRIARAMLPVFSGLKYTPAYSNVSFPSSAKTLSPTSLIIGIPHSCT